MFSRPVHALRRVHADVVPFLSALWTSVVAGACAERGGDPFSSPDRTKIRIPTLTREGQRHPANRDAFHRSRPRQAFIRRIAPPNESCASVPRSRRPHVLHKLWRVPSGHCKHQSAVTRDPWHSRNSAFFTDGFDPFESFVPGTDDPSAPFGSPKLARLRELIALLVATPDAAPQRLLRPRVRGPMCRELHESVYA